MAVSLKRKRKIVVNGRLFLWCVKLDEDDSFETLHLVSDDKEFAVSYKLKQGVSFQCRGSDTCHLVLTVMGRYFPGFTKTVHGHFVRTPVWSDDVEITPHFVRQLLEWCFDENKSIILVDWKGDAL